MCNAANDEEVNSRLAKLRNVYKEEHSEQRSGLPKLAEKYGGPKYSRKS